MRMQSVIVFMVVATTSAPAVSQQVTSLPNAPGTPVQRFEIGVSYSNLGINTCLQTIRCQASVPPYSQAPAPPQNAVGLSFTFNLDRHWSVDTAYDVTPGYYSTPDYFATGAVAGGRSSKALGGARFNLRARKYSLFAYGKTGAVIWSKIESDVDDPVSGVLLRVGYREEAFFAVGAGVGVEYSPSPRVHLRLSAGDLVVDYGYARFSGCSVCFDGEGTAWNHNSDATATLSFGLGKAIASPLPAADTNHVHWFLDKTNLALIGVDLLAQTADAVGTQHFIQNGWVEQDGLARPLVNQGWPGQIASISLNTAVEVLAIYGLHRMGHHRLERLAPLAATATSGYLGYESLKNWGAYEAR